MKQPDELAKEYEPKKQRINIDNQDKIHTNTAKEKSHTCEEGGACLRISFWHLLMNLKDK